MFILLLRYKTPLEEVMKHLEAHCVYLDKYYAQEKFVCSGPQNPRTGGCILCKSVNVNEINEIIKEDPFYSEGIADYEIIEITPTKCAPGFEKFIQ